MTLWGNKWHVSFCSIKIILHYISFRPATTIINIMTFVFANFMTYTVVSEDIFIKWH